MLLLQLGELGAREPQVVLGSLRLESLGSEALPQRNGVLIHGRDAFEVLVERDGHRTQHLECELRERD